MGLHIHLLSHRINGEPISKQQMYQEDKEENQKQRRLDHQMLAAMFYNLGIVDIIDEIK